MRIEVAKGKVLDTSKGVFEESTQFDESMIGTPIIFNIKEVNGVKKCSCADSKVIRNNMDYNKIKEMIARSGAKTPYEDLGQAPKAKAAAKAPKAMNLSEMAPNANSQIQSADDFAKTVEKELKKTDKIEKDAAKAEYTHSNEEYRSQIFDANMGVKIEEGSQDQTCLTGQNLQAKNVIIDKAMEIISNNWPLYYQMLLGVDKRYFDTPDDPICPTMAVTIRNMLINSDFVLHMSVEECVFVLCHELLHMTLGHPARSKGTDPYVWNDAADLIVNKTLCQDFGITPDKGRKGTVEFMKGGLYSDTVDIVNDTVEDVYDSLMSGTAVSREKKLILSLIESIIKARGEVEYMKQQLDPVLQKEVEDKLKDIDSYISKLGPLLAANIGGK